MSVSNIDKLLQYFKCVAKEPIKYGGCLDTDSGLRIVDENDKLITIVGSDVKIQSIKLNQTFFYTDTCLNCGGCDPAESNIFTQCEYDKIQAISSDEFESYGLDSTALEELKSGLVQTEHTINGKIVHTWSYAQTKNELYLPTRGKKLNRCSWCFQDKEHKFKCKIHPVVSITCTMPHLRFYHVNKSSNTSMGIHQFGRNWALKCPVTFSEPQDEFQFNYNKADRIFKLQRLLAASEDLNIETYLPEVIEYVDNLEFETHQNYLDVNILKVSKQSIQLF